MIEEKKALRKRMIQLRNALSDDERRRMSHSITRQILALPELKSDIIPCVFCYVSYRSEVDTHELLECLWEESIPVAVPRTEGECIRFYRVQSQDDLETGYMGISEPKAYCEEAVPGSDTTGIVITPGLAFSEDGGRIGYGGGFYDRFFAKNPSYLRVAAAYSCQIIEEIPTEACDLHVNKIVAPEKVYDCNSGQEEDERWN